MTTSAPTDDAYEQAVAPLLATNNHAVVVGSAGSGKTTVALRKASLAIDGGLTNGYQRVLFLSFANATVDRVAEHAAGQLTKAQRSQLEVGTYHSFAWSILRSHGYLLGAPRGVKIMSQAEQNSFRSHLEDPDADLKAEFLRQFETLGHVRFDDFAALANAVLKGNATLLKAYASAYPLIVLDEFQDTTDDQWALAQTLGGHSRLIALGDPNQRIYDFVDVASDSRFEDFAAAFAPLKVDLSAWNWRSPGSSITRFGRDILRGKLEGSYDEIHVKGSGYPPLMTLKSEVLQALNRLKKRGGGTLAILTPTNSLSGRVYEYIGTAQERPPYPALSIDIHAGKEEGYAALIFIASVMQIQENDEQRYALACEAMAVYLRTKSNKVANSVRTLATRLESYAAKLRDGTTPNVKIVKALQLVVDTSIKDGRTGHALDDYFTSVGALGAADASELPPIASAARMLNFMTRGSEIETALAAIWRSTGTYVDASSLMRSAVMQYQLTSSKRGSRDLVVMTIHRAKGREFDEVIVYEEQHTPLLRPNPSQRDLDSARYALNVAVTRAKQRVTVITPSKAVTPLLGP
jgi:DNA helicase-2/ATP-dependent DNA helicase PcrA